jgi:hypothetical protein
MQSSRARNVKAGRRQLSVPLLERRYRQNPFWYTLPRYHIPTGKGLNAFPELVFLFEQSRTIQDKKEKIRTGVSGVSEDSRGNRPGGLLLV